MHDFTSSAPFLFHKSFYKHQRSLYYMVTREQIIKFLILHTSDLQFNSLFCHARALAFLMEGLLVLMDTKTSKYAQICPLSETKMV